MMSNDVGNDVIDNEDDNVTDVDDEIVDNEADLVEPDEIADAVADNEADLVEQPDAVADEVIMTVII